MILVIDNFDSFVHNLARYFRQLGVETETVRNDAITCDQIESMSPDAIVISPGPCTPDEAGVSLELVERFVERIPILGVCLGHQAIVQALGGTITQAENPMHGRSSRIEHDSKGIFAGVASPLTVGRYHSLVAVVENLPDSLSVSATIEDGTIMAVRHIARPVVGVQFHPESILTESGYQMISNFLDVAGIRHIENEGNQFPSVFASANDDVSSGHATGKSPDPFKEKGRTLATRLADNNEGTVAASNSNNSGGQL